MIGVSKRVVTVTEEHRIRLPADAGEVGKVIGVMTQQVIQNELDEISHEAAANRISMSVEGDVDDGPELVLSIVVSDSVHRPVMLTSDHRVYVDAVRTVVGRSIDRLNYLLDAETRTDDPNRVRAKLREIWGDLSELSQKW